MITEVQFTAESSQEQMQIKFLLEGKVSDSEFPEAHQSSFLFP